MYKLNLPIKEDLPKYNPPSFFINRGIESFVSYDLTVDGYTIYLTKEKFILSILDYCEEIKRLVLDMNDNISILNNRQITLIYQNTKLEDIDHEMISRYRNKTLLTNTALSVVSNTRRLVEGIVKNINNIIKMLNDKYENVYTYYVGGYENVNNFIKNLQIENENLPLSFFIT